MFLFGDFNLHAMHGDVMHVSGQALHTHMAEARIGVTAHNFFFELRMQKRRASISMVRKGQKATSADKQGTTRQFWLICEIMTKAAAVMQGGGRLVLFWRLCWQLQICRHFPAQSCMPLALGPLPGAHPAAHYTCNQLV